MSYTLVKSLAEITAYLKLYENPWDVIALDLETNANPTTAALDTRRAKIVSIQLCKKAGTGIYIPIGHQLGTNLPLAPVIEIMKTHVGERYTFLVQKGQYDLNVIQANTGWDIVRVIDMLELTYLEDPDRKRKGLKLVVKEDLGFDMTQFEDLFTEEEKKRKDFDISRKAPASCVNYGCADVDYLLQLFETKVGVLKENAFHVSVDTKLMNVVRKTEHNGGMVLREDYIKVQMEILKRREDALREQVWRMVGQEFEINSPKQLGNVLFGVMGIPSPGMTKGKNPQHRTDAKVLEGMARMYPIIEYVLTYRKVSKAKGTYFEKLDSLRKSRRPVRFCFNIYSAPTFRFAAPGGDPDEDGFTGVNIQAVSSGEVRDFPAVDLTRTGSKVDFVGQVGEEDLLVAKKDAPTNGTWNGDLSSLPWVVEREPHKGEPGTPLVCFRETCAGCPVGCEGRGIDTTRRLVKGVKMLPSVRQAFTVPDEYTLVSFDYDRQEIVIGANLSGEMNWIKALQNNEDLHAMTAAKAINMAFTEFLELKKSNFPEYNRIRQIGKIMNFATFYGANEYTLAQQALIPLEQARLMYDGFVRGHPQLFSWIEKVKLAARRNGYTTTYFGRKRWLKQFYAMNDKKMNAFADRSAVNTCIQGTGAEVTRIAIVKVDAELKKQKLTSKEVRLVIQLHDDLTYMVKKDKLDEIAPIIKDKMEFKVKSWAVQLTTGMKVGPVWGTQEAQSV